METIICSNCVMDTTDPKITFDEKGVCDNCENFYKNTLPQWHTGEKGMKLLKEITKLIKII